MKAVIKNKTGIITVPPEFSRIVDIDSSKGVITYSFDYDVDIIRAIKEEISTVEIRVTSRKPDPERSPFKDNANRRVSNPRDLIRNIRKRNPEIKDKKRSIEKITKRTKRSDITSVLNNSKASRIKSLSRENSQKILDEKFSATLKSKKDMELQNKNSPVFRSRQTFDNGAMKGDFQKMALRSLFSRQGLDPTSVYDKSPNISGEIKRLSGLSTINSESKNVTSDERSFIASIIGAASSNIFKRFRTFPNVFKRNLRI